MKVVLVRLCGKNTDTISVNYSDDNTSMLADVDDDDTNNEENTLMHTLHSWCSV